MGGRRKRIAPQRKNKLFKLSFSRQSDTQNKVQPVELNQGTLGGPNQTMAVVQSAIHGNRGNKEEDFQIETEVINTEDSSQEEFQQAKNRKGKRKANFVLFNDIKSKRVVNIENKFEVLSPDNNNGVDKNNTLIVKNKRLPPFNIVLESKEIYDKIKEMLKLVTFKYSLFNKSRVKEVAIYVYTKEHFRELQTLIASNEFKFHL